jgi:hypothetical protein
MPAHIAALVHAMLAMGLAAAVLPADTFGGLRLRALGAWFLAALLLFMLDDPFVIFTVLFLAYLTLGPAAPGKRVAFFILIAPAFPVYMQQYLPFPGINYLLLLDYYRVASCALLVPLLFIPKPDDTPRLTWSITDSCVVTYVIYSSMMVASVDTLTSGLRFMLEQTLVIAAPYFAISRAATRLQDVDTALKAFLVASAILAAVALLATAKQWDFYRYKEPISVISIPDFRAGFLRIAATINTHSLGFHLAAAVLVLEYVRTRVKFGFLRLWFLRFMLLAGMYFTGSRGSIAGLATAIGVYMVLRAKSTGMRWMLVMGFLAASAFAAIWLLSGDSAKYDPYGTFDYRQQLLIVSLRYIAEYPIFGDLTFMRSGKFDSLIQGQGIIDITNLYLLVALRFGLLGLTLFFVPFMVTMYRLVFAEYDDPGGETRKLKHMRAVICSVMAGWLVLVVTTSDVGLTLHLGILLVALGHGLTQTRAVAHKAIQFSSAVR